MNPLNPPRTRGGGRASRVAAVVWRPAGGQSFTGGFGSIAFGWTHRDHAACLHGNVVELHKLAVIKSGKQRAGIIDQHKNSHLSGPQLQAESRVLPS